MLCTSTEVFFYSRHQLKIAITKFSNRRVHVLRNRPRKWDFKKYSKINFLELFSNRVIVKSFTKRNWQNIELLQQEGNKMKCTVKIS